MDRPVYMGNKKNASLRMQGQEGVKKRRMLATPSAQVLFLSQQEWYHRLKKKFVVLERSS